MINFVKIQSNHQRPNKCKIHALDFDQHLYINIIISSCDGYPPAIILLYLNSVHDLDVA